MDKHNFEYSLNELKEATSLMKNEKALKLSAQIDFLSKSKEGITFLYEKCGEISDAGYFDESPWANPNKLVPSLVKGTLKSGHPSSTIEIVSELRILAYAEGKLDHSNFSSKEALNFLEDAIVHNLEFAFKDPVEETRSLLSKQELEKCFNLFEFLMENVKLEGIKEKLSDEIKMICAQRPIVTRKVRGIIQMIKDKIELNPGNEVDDKLKYYVEALFAPSDTTKSNPDPKEYAQVIRSKNEAFLKSEAETLSSYMRETGLSNPYIAALLLELTNDYPNLVPHCLQLDERGIAEWNKHRKIATDLIRENISIYNYFSIYGFARLLEKNLFSRSALKAALNNLRNIKINPQVEERIMKSVSKPHPSVSPKQYLIAATIQVLGQPLGIGQGNNSTCQSARGISIWSRHSPSRLLNKIITVATQNNLVVRFENDDIESMKLGKGLVDELDFDLDAVSAVIVPHLDKIYNEMMHRANYRGEDPHKWVNPAMYGHWVQVGFISAYNETFHIIQDFKKFVRTFYAAFHPEYNGGNQMIYPNPVGIFVTTSRGIKVGLHAVSLLRVSKVKITGEIRAYFLNPNNEGRQDWGQDIQPTVFGNGEKRGESSLPFYQFTARIYAFHYNPLDIADHLRNVPEKEISKVEKLAKESWGKSYTWSDVSQNLSFMA